MKKILFQSTILSILALCFFGFSIKEKHASKISFYDFSIKSLDGKSTINFSSFKGKKVLCVNTASMCGFTRQYDGLEKLYEKHKNNLVIIGFPCNQFGEQEPWDAKQIGEFCKGRYNVSFPMTEKVIVRGDTAHAIYKWLTQKELNGVKDVTIRWNFGKFLIDEKGKFVEYFPSDIEPDDPKLISYIEKK
jgi:glutathione peroxidase